MPTSTLLFGPVGPELVVIFILFLILFGGNKIQQVARGTGEAIAEFKRGEQDGKQKFSQAANPQSEPTAVVDDSAEPDSISKPDISPTDDPTTNSEDSVERSKESKDTERVSPEEANIPDLTKKDP